jgi:hypothetical protein
MASYNSYKNVPTEKRGCPLCDGTCGRCLVPAEVIASLESRGDDRAKIMGILGPTNVGKTVLLGMLLDLLARGVGGLHGVPRGAFSLGLHKNVLLALEKQRFPEKTPNEPDRWNWVHCEVSNARKSRSSKSFDIVCPDVAGEAVAQELTIPNSNPIIRALIAKCAGLVVLIDLATLVDEGGEAEIFAMQLIAYLIAMRPPKRGRKLDIPVALVFTKSDLSDEPISDPNSFARANTNALWKICENQLHRFRFFASGVAGSVGWLVGQDGVPRSVPLRIEPRGIVEPFGWLFSQYR